MKKNDVLIFNGLYEIRNNTSKKIKKQEAKAIIKLIRKELKRCQT
jgi:hypothetical protein